MGLFNRRKFNGEIESLCQNIVIGGEAGEGIKSAGKIIAQSLLSSKFDVYLYDEYPSLIRGGHNAVYITYSPYPVYSVNREIDTLVCFDRQSFDKHKFDLNKGSIVIYDHEEFKLNDNETKDFPCELIDLPINQILKRNKYPKIVQNILYVCVTLCVLGIEKKVVTKTIKRLLGRKPDALALNLHACEEAYEAAVEYQSVKKYDSKDFNSSKKNQYFISGNEALSIGAIQGGLGFYAAYPMTPASSILDFMFQHYRSKSFVVKQSEDEIAAINMAIGAAYAGARSMVGTSGGGFSLMVEALGLAAITETPLTVVISQRPGPSTGLPTWTGQADLLFALHASQDEFPRIILTPTDQEEAMQFGFLAMNLAEKFQLTVIILMDKQISESFAKIYPAQIPKLKIDRGLMLNTRALSRMDNFKRYEITEKGISPRSVPGQPNGIHIANSDESDEHGFSIEDSATRIQKVEKRFAKTSQLIKEMPDLNIYGDIRSKTCLVTWGSTKGAALEAVRRLQNIGVSIKLLALNYVSPFPTDEVIKFLRNCNSVVLVEGNYSSQLGQVIKANTGFSLENSLLKYDGRPIFPDEIVKKVLDSI